LYRGGVEVYLCPFETCAQREVTGWRHKPAALKWRKEPPVPIRYEAVLARKHIRPFCKREISVAPARSQLQYHPTHNLVIINE